ncbi:MAG: HD domain-containing protein [Alphaproteobacteria bacterium]|nr:HD domain-containing protein [Alphaproteobacteria bacterium]
MELLRVDSEASRLASFEAPRRSVVVIHPDARSRDAVGRELASFYEVSDYPDIESAAVRTKATPAAVLVADTAIANSDRLQALPRLRAEKVFHQVPMILCTWAPKQGRASAPIVSDADAVVDFNNRDRDLIGLIARLVDHRVEARWETLAPSPREALKRTLAAFDGITDLIATGDALDFHNIGQACAPVLDAVKQDGYHQIFEGLANHNSFIYVHSLRVSTLLVLFGYKLGLGDDDLMTLATAGLLHDIGKTGMPQALLNKVSPLDPTEKIRMRDHVLLGVRYLSKAPDVPSGVMAIAAQHHERLDGTGYPDGLQGNQINDLVRIAAVVDVFAALTERRSYRAPMSAAQALSVMTNNIREKFDQKFVALFRDMLLSSGG